MLACLSPTEIWVRSKSLHSGLINAHPWGCPLYVLQPHLQDGGKLPKWEPQSRHAQYMGTPPLHTSTVGLIQNLGTNPISPQFHCVYHNSFSMVHSAEGEPPAEWPEMLIFDRFRSDFDDTDFVLDLAEESLTLIEVVTHRNQEQTRRDSATPQDGHAPQRAPEEPPQRVPDETPQRAPDPFQRAPYKPPQRVPDPPLEQEEELEDPPFIDSLMDELPVAEPPPTYLRRITWVRKPTGVRLESDSS
jgi:hypothetical protein